MVKTPITLKLNREIWRGFIRKVKGERKQVGEVVEPFMTDYTKHEGKK